MTASPHPIIRVFDCHVARPKPTGGFEFLVLRRSGGKIYAGTWRMVGGKLKDGESAWKACLREIGEETRLPVKRLLTVPYVNRFYEWKHDRINDIPVFVAVTAPDATPVLDAEHTDHLWCDEADAVAKLPWPGQQEGLMMARRLLTGEVDLQDFMEIELESDGN